IQPLQPIASNCTPPDHFLIYLGDPYLQLTNLPLHTSDGQLFCPPYSICDRHTLGCKFNDGLSSKVKQPICVVERSNSVYGFHGVDFPGQDEESPLREIVHGRNWHRCDMPTLPANVR